MSKWLSLSLVALAACQFTTSVGGGTRSTGPTTSSSSSSGSRPMTMPNLFLMTQAEAEATLRRLGFEKQVAIDTSSTCGSVVDGKIVELGRVCYQTPAPGKVTSTTLPKMIRVQHENPYRGKLGGGREWFLMPNLVGQHVDQAREAMRGLGFVSKEVKIVYVDECEPNLVCRTYPETLSRTDTTSDKLFYVGKSPAVETSAERP